MLITINPQHQWLHSDHGLRFSKLQFALKLPKLTETITAKHQLPCQQPLAINEPTQLTQAYESHQTHN